MAKSTKGSDRGGSKEEAQRAISRALQTALKGSVEEISRQLNTLPNGLERQTLKAATFGIRYGGMSVSTFFKAWRAS